MTHTSGASRKNNEDKLNYTVPLWNGPLVYLKQTDGRTAVGQGAVACGARTGGPAANVNIPPPILTRDFQNVLGEFPSFLVFRPKDCVRFAIIASKP